MNLIITIFVYHCDLGEFLMKKEITLTEDIVNQLKNEGWLSDKQYMEYMGDGLGFRYSYEDMEILCKDYDLLDSLFEEKLKMKTLKMLRILL